MHAYLLFACIICRVHAASLELVTYATELQHEGLDLLRQTARWHGWSPLHIIGTQEGYNKHLQVDKVRALRRFTRQWPDNTIIVFVDGYDVIINNEPAKLESAFLASGKRVLTASELGCCTDKQTAMQYKTECHKNWPFASIGDGRRWLNSGVIVGYARDVRRLLNMAWKEYKTNPQLYQMFTDQQVLCHLLSDGSNIWTRAAVGIDHGSEIALSTYKTSINLGDVLGIDKIGRVVFANRTVPSIIHFNGPFPEKQQQISFARNNFPSLSASVLAQRA